MRIQSQDRSSERGPAAVPARPKPAESALLALQRSAGNAAVSRAIQLARHQHGPECRPGTAPGPEPSGEAAARPGQPERSEDTRASVQRCSSASGGHPVIQRCCAEHDLAEPAVQRRVSAPEPDRPGVARQSSVFDAKRSPGSPLASHILQRAQQAYGVDFSHVRVHSDAVARQSAQEYGALAYTSGSSIVVSRAAVDDETMFHEVDHVHQQMRGPVAGTDDGSGAKVSHRGDPFEVSAAANGRRLARGEAPHLGHPAGGAAGTAVQRAPATTHVQRAPATAHVQRAPAGTSAQGAGTTSWERKAQKVGDLVKACTCEQNMRQWGRVAPEVMVRHTRSYKNQRDEQSLRHAVRRVYRAVAWLEEQNKQEDSRPAMAAEGAAEAGKDKVRKTEDEIQGMLFNGRLAFASNLNQTVQALHRHLLDAADESSDTEDAPGQGLVNVLLKDFDEEDASEADDEREERAEGSVASGKRPAPGGDQQGGKRRKTGRDPAAPRLGSSIGPDEKRRRDRRARRKLAEGLIPAPRVENLPELPSQDEMYKRDNATTRALRNVKWVRKVDISNQAATDPKYRAYLSALLSKSEADYDKYAFLLHNGGNDDVLHAEQKLMMFMHNAGVTKETEHDPVLIRGLKRPCKACLALLDYFRDELGINVRYNPNGGHFFQNALGAIAQNFPDAFEKKGEGDKNWFAHNMTDQRPMYASSVTGVTPGPEAREGHAGGMQEPMELEANGAKRNYPTNAMVVPTLDSASSSDDEGYDSALSLSGLEQATGALSLRGPAAKARPAPAVNRGAQKEQAEAHFLEQVAPLLSAAMTPQFLAEWQRRPAAGGGKYDAVFPEALRTAVEGVLAQKASTQSRVAAHLKLSAAALGKQLKKEEPKQAGHIRGHQDKVDALKAAMAPDFRAEWQRHTEQGTYWTPAFPDGLRRLTYETIADGISWTSVGEFMRIKPNTFANRWKAMKKEWGDPKEDRGEGSAGGG
ncbi:DUF4157 domain-containing protein [Streptomyces ziwulingensis]|uniref:eCIS core domain-containing protein n=1 Tax=Streptomyces ziwulingensis TaxID=1045501 RepID=A0ABP9CEP6_9ACTN